MSGGVWGGGISSSTKILTGTTSVDNTTIDHGLPVDSIINVWMVVHAGYRRVGPVFHASVIDQYYYTMYYSDESIHLESQQSLIDSQPYKVVITYTT